MKRVIVAQLNIKDEYINTFLTIAKSMVNNTLLEPGCICYKLLDAMDVKGEFFFYEEYINDDAVTSHNASPHFKTFGESIAPLLTKDPVIDIF